MVVVTHPNCLQLRALLLAVTDLLSCIRQELSALIFIPNETSFEDCAVHPGTFLGIPHPHCAKATMPRNTLRSIKRRSTHSRIQT